MSAQELRAGGQEEFAAIVRALVATGAQLTFDELFQATEARLPGITATELDDVARQYESGAPGSLRYVVRAAPATQLDLWAPEASPCQPGAVNGIPVLWPRNEMSDGPTSSR